MSVSREANFAVGTPEGPQSCVWKIKTTARGDIYFMVRRVGGEFKVSFHPADATHSQPIWRAALTSEHMRRADALRLPSEGRLMFEWPHPETDYAPGVKRVFGIIVPEAAISLPADTTARSLNLLTPPFAGMWTLLWVWIANHVVIWPPPGIESTRLVAALLLPNDQWLSVSHHHVPAVEISGPPGAISTEVAAAIQATADLRAVVHGTFDGVEVWIEMGVEIDAAQNDRIVDGEPPSGSVSI